MVRLIDGPLAPISCVSVTAYEPCSCPDEAHCGLRMLMLDVRNAIARILDRYVIKRPGEPEEIAQAALYLTSDESSFVTGAALAVDGGRTFH